MTPPKDLTQTSDALFVNRLTESATPIPTRMRIPSQEEMAMVDVILKHKGEAISAAQPGLKDNTVELRKYVLTILDKIDIKTKAKGGDSLLKAFNEALQAPQVAAPQTPTLG